MNKAQKWILTLSLISIIIFFVCFIGILSIYNTPKIVLNGEETITINLYEKYEESGATAYIHNKNHSNEIKISNNINENEPGNYTVTYSLKNAKAKRNVIVKDNIAPVIHLNGKEKVIIKLNSDYIDEGAKAVDNINGDITNEIITNNNVDTSQIGEYEVIYKVKDLSGNETTKTRIVLVREDDTLVRVSIAEQKIEVYKNNELIITSPIVTGTEKYTETDKGIFKIYYKSKNVYLKGVGYLTFVNYWMPYNGGEGLHDATWREEFGGEIYKTNGSHGCVNLPLEIAEKVYDAVSIGTTVEVY